MMSSDDGNLSKGDSAGSCSFGFTGDDHVMAEPVMKLIKAPENKWHWFSCKILIHCEAKN